MMFNKRYMAILLFLIIGVFAISQASAADLNATDAIAGDVANDGIIGDVVNEEVSSDLNNTETATDVQGDEQVVSNENDDVLTGNYGTFTDLNNLISRTGVDSSTGFATITLDRDYVYDVDVDDEYLATGLDIKKNVIIIGNDHWIYANGARVFWVYSSSQLGIGNLNIISSYDYDAFKEVLNDELDLVSEYGGAIVNQGTLILNGCTFMYNCAEQGGAIYSDRKSVLYITNCNFINNTATFEGGAICNYGQAIITADQGKYSVFVNNSAFTYDTYGYGGAISSSNELYVYNSGFLSNVADYGGAVFNEQCNISHIDSSAFLENYAFQAGGAVCNSIVLNSEFDKTNMASSNAGNNGHNMYSGVAIKCNSADSNTRNFVNTAISTGLKYGRSSNTPTEYIQGTTGKTYQVLVTSNPDGEKVKGVKVRLVIDNNANYNYTAITDQNGLATFTLPYLSEGYHTFTTTLVYTGLSTTTKINTFIHVGKYASSVKFDKQNITYYYGDTGITTVTTVTIDGGKIGSAIIQDHPEIIPIINGNVIQVSGLEAGNYVLKVTIDPDEKHKDGSGFIAITVNKKTAVITARAFTTQYNNGKKWSVTLRDTTSNTPLSGAKVTFRVYTGSSYRNYQATTNANGVATFAQASKLAPGTHRVVVIYSNPKYYNCKSVTTSIKVTKKTLRITAISKKMAKNGDLYVQVKDGSKPLNGIKVNLKVYTGGSYRNFNLITGYDGKVFYSHGRVMISSNAFSAGNHLVRITIVSPYYQGSISSYLKIPKVTGKRYTAVLTAGRVRNV